MEYLVILVVGDNLCYFLEIGSVLTAWSGMEYLVILVVILVVLLLLVRNNKKDSEG